MGKMSRAKGADYERKVARLFDNLGWHDAKRHLEYQGPEADEGRDLDDTQPFAVQCKCYASTPSVSSIEQVRPTAEYPIPLAFLRRQGIGKKKLEVVVMNVGLFYLIMECLDNDDLDWIEAHYGQDVDNLSDDPDSIP